MNTNRFEDNWWAHFVTECYFDTVLAKALLNTKKKLWHVHGCANVAKELQSKRLNGDFAVALIDKDKTEIDYLNLCDKHFEVQKLVLWKHKTMPQFIIQLNPPLEKWIIEVLETHNLKIEDFGYPRDYKKLKKKIKNEISSERDVQLNQLVSAIINTNNDSVKKLKAMLIHLKQHHTLTDINELKNV